MLLRWRGWLALHSWREKYGVAINFLVLALVYNLDIALKVGGGILEVLSVSTIAVLLATSDGSSYGNDEHQGRSPENWTGSFRSLKKLPLHEFLAAKVRERTQ